MILCTLGLLVALSTSLSTAAIGNLETDVTMTLCLCLSV